jgi:F-box and WD-40 domain protein CDC4
MDPLGIANGRVTPNRPRTPLKESAVCRDTPSSLPREDDARNHSEPETFPSPVAGPPSPPSFLEAPAMAATPPAADHDAVVYHERGFGDEKRATPSLDTSVARLDASLPSPVYSPVTAVASPSLSELEDNEEIYPLERTRRAPRLDLALAEEEAGMSPFGAMSKAVDCFDSLPQQLQKYLAFQLLRRSDKSVLQFIAGIVNPALKCDFLARLPVELALHVVGYLDAASLCLAAQVSRKWRQLVDSYDRVWKELLDKDGFELPAGELERAIAEGWAWQGAEPFEADLSRVLRRKDRRPETPRMIGYDSYASESTGSKRRALAQMAPMKKRRVDYETQAENAKIDASDVISPDFPRVLLPDLPLALEADHPALGLRSLRVPHLFKAIYRRQQCIRSSWMEVGTEPRHMAFRAHGRHVVTCLQFDDDKILTGSDDTKIHVYETGTGALRTVLDGHEGGVWALQCVGNTLVSGSTDRTVRIWDVEKGRCRHVFHGHTSTVRCLVVLQPAQVGVDARGQPIMMPRRPLIITGSRDATLRVWRLPAEGAEDGAPEEPDEGRVRGDGRGGLTLPPPDGATPYFVRALHGHMHSVRSIAAHGDTLVSGSYDSTVRVWRVSTGETVHRLAGHASKVYSVILDHARARCVSGSMDNMVKVWSLETGACLYNLEGHSSLVGLLDLSHGRLVSAAADSTLRVWDPENGHCRNLLAAHTGAITCFQHDAQKVISGSDRSLKMWDVRTGMCVRDLLTDLSGGWQVRFNDRKCVAAVQRRNRTYIEVLFSVAWRERG